MSTEVLYGVTLDAEVAILYLVTTNDQKLENLDIEDPIPLRDSPAFAIKVNTIEFIPTWCEVDTCIGALTVHLDERTCFDAEAYIDELDLQKSAVICKDQRRQLSVNNTPTTLPTMSTVQNVNLPLLTTSALPQSLTTPSAAFTMGPLTASAATGSQQPDYFFDSHHNSPTSPTGPSGNLTLLVSTGSELLGRQLSTPE
ncbi:3347_t:CDS:2, partial [Gigaspora margarita]